LWIIYRRQLLTQPKQVPRIIEAFQVDMGAPSPALMKLMSDEEYSHLLKDQSDYMSMIMFLSQWTYPELCPAAIKLSTKYNKANDLDIKKSEEGRQIYLRQQGHTQNGVIS
jgi:hypothetical protein